MFYHHKFFGKLQRIFVGKIIGKAVGEIIGKVASQAVGEFLRIYVRLKFLKRLRQRLKEFGETLKICYNGAFMIF
ncbi:hypothetical protein B0181_01830 [Moraxella caviae]|uniref:Uncharacterized protein n=1 Tax=Moraxella caviae TaxID=34060 RepID=A0A1T0A9E9_9GAMM|nr:hypothetical protein [Moraxella caviae]OOR92353.1 hypothetical protein B0181_01830 [Moraxella caviae]